MRNAQLVSKRAALAESIHLMEQVKASLRVSLKAAKEALGSLDVLIQESKEEFQQFDRILLIPIDELEISARIVIRLNVEGIYYVGDLVRYSWKEILEIKGLAQKSAFEIKEVLASRGLALGMKIPNWPPVGLKRP